MLKRLRFFVIGFKSQASSIFCLGHRSQAFLFSCFLLTTIYHSLLRSYCPEFKIAFSLLLIRISNIDILAPKSPVRSKHTCKTHSFSPHIPHSCQTVFWKLIFDISEHCSHHIQNKEQIAFCSLISRRYDSYGIWR